MAQGSSEVYEVKIAGIPLRLRSSHSAETVGEIVNLVNEKIQEALAATPNGSIQTAAILAALNLAEAQWSIKQQTLGDLNRLEALAQSVISDLETTKVPQTGLEV